MGIVRAILDIYAPLPTTTPPQTIRTKHHRKTKRRYTKLCNNHANYLYTCNKYNCSLCKHKTSIITNLSDINLSAAEESLLSKGLKFIPTARDISRKELLSGFDAFRTKFWRSNNTIPTETTTTTKSPFFRAPQNTLHTPTYLLPPLTEGLLDEIRQDLWDLPTQTIDPNLTKQERAALIALKNNKDIVINHGDKGSSIVIQNRWDYIKNNEDHLQDPLAYTQLEGDPTGALL